MRKIVAAKLGLVLMISAACTLAYGDCYDSAESGLEQCIERADGDKERLARCERNYEKRTEQCDQRESAQQESSQQQYQQPIQQQPYQIPRIVVPQRQILMLPGVQ